MLWFHEAMPAGRWIGFVLVWIALVVFTVEAINTGAASSAAAEASPVCR